MSSLNHTLSASFPGSNCELSRYPQGGGCFRFLHHVWKEISRRPLGRRLQTAPQNGHPWVKRSAASCGHLPSAFRATALHPSTPNSATDGVEGFLI